MNFFLIFIKFILIFPISFIVVYKLLPFRKISRKPKIVIFPKYRTQYTIDTYKVESILNDLGFVIWGGSSDSSIYVRGYFYNFLSIDTIELRVEVIKSTKTLKIYSPWFLLYESSKLWQIASTITDEANYNGKKFNFEHFLKNNKNWPYEIVGELDIIDCGFDLGEKYPSWSVGFIDSDVAQGDEIGIDTVNTTFFKDAEIDIDKDMNISILIDIPKENRNSDFNSVSIGSDSIYEIVAIKKL